MACLKTVDRYNYKHNCLYLALKVGGLSDIKLQHLKLALRIRTIHKCDLSNVCNEVQINIEIASIRNDGKTELNSMVKIMKRSIFWD